SPRGGGPLRGAWSRRVLRAARGRPRPRLPHVRRAQPRAGPPRRGACSGRDRECVLLRDADPSPACAPAARPRRRCASGDRARLAGEPRAANVGGDPGGSPGARGFRRERIVSPTGLRNILIPINRHRIWQVVADGGLIALAWWLAFELRFDQGVPRYYHTLFTKTVLIVVGIKLLVFILFGFYDRWWRYVSTRDMWSAARGVTVASLVASVTVYFANPVAQVRLPRSVAVMDWLLLLAFVAGSRLIARSVFERPTPGPPGARGKEVLVIGAGEAARDTIREMPRNQQLGYTPIGLVDDDPRKKNIRIHGVRVLGTTADLPHLLRDNRPDEVLIAVP